MTMGEFAARHGLLTDIPVLERYVESFEAEMVKGLEGKSSLAMLPTYIEPENAAAFGRDVIVIDAGGSNLRIALVALLPDGAPEIKYFEKYRMLGADSEIGADAFFDTLAGYLEPVAGRSDHIGMCFSFPAEIMQNRDAKILHLDKEVRVTGAEGQVLGERLRDALRARGLPHKKSVVVINDTVAAQLGAMVDKSDPTVYGGYVGLILGTGLNSCYTERNAYIKKNAYLRERPGGSIINMESGGFAGVPQGDIDRAFIAATKDPTQQSLEKMVSGAYQPGLLLSYLKAAAEERLFSPAFADRAGGVARLTGLDIDRFCDLPFGDNLLAGLCQGEADAVALYELAHIYFDRVAALTAVNLIAILRKMGAAAKNPCRPVCVSAEGTTFYKARLLRPKLDYFMSACAQRRMGLHYRFTKVESATISGSAVAGLLGN